MRSRLKDNQSGIIEILIIEFLQEALAGTLLDNKLCIHCCCAHISRGRVVWSVWF